MRISIKFSKIIIMENGTQALFMLKSKHSFIYMSTLAANCWLAISLIIVKIKKESVVQTLSKKYLYK